MPISNILDIIIKGSGSVAVIIAIWQLFHSWKKRRVDMYWKIAEIYLSKESRESRQALDELLNKMPNLKTYLESKQKDKQTRNNLINEFITRFHNAQQGTKEKEICTKARTRLRFLHQTGIIYKKNLIDKKLLFELIGTGFEIDFPILDIIIEGYRRPHNFPKMYNYFEYLWLKYHKWKKYNYK